MYKLSTRSKERYNTLHEDLKKLVLLVLRHVDIGVVEGYRDKTTQNKYFSAGKSKVQYPNSKHNVNPSNAMDLGVYINNKLTFDPKYYYYLNGIIQAYALTMKVGIRWGGDWDGDGDYDDQSFNDLMHWELK